MPTSVEPTRPPLSDRRVFLTATALAALDLVVLMMGVSMLTSRAFGASYGYPVPQDIWMPFILVALATALANGAGLALWRPTRLVGLGIIVATVAVALLMMGLVAYLIMSLGS